MAQPPPQPPRRPPPPSGPSGPGGRPPPPGRPSGGPPLQGGQGGPPPPGARPSGGPPPPGARPSGGPPPPQGGQGGGPPPPARPACPKVATPDNQFDENHLPSVLHRPDPMTPEQERQNRRRTCRFIEEAGGRSLKLPRVAVATATVFFHRFYSRHAFQEHDRFEVAMACLLLAGKTEESPKKLDLVIRECWKLRRRAQAAQQKLMAGGAGGESPSTPGMSPTTAELRSPGGGGNPDNIQIDPKSEEYVRLKERVLLLERVILHTIGFELSIDHPYKFVVDCVQQLNKKRLLEYADPPSTDKKGMPLSKGAQNNQLVQQLAQNAINFANDSMHTTLCLQFAASEIGTACVYLSGKYSGIRPANGRPWIELLEGITAEELTSISVQILELLSLKEGAEREMFKNIRRDLDKMAGDGAPSAKRQKTTA